MTMPPATPRPGAARLFSWIPEPRVVRIIALTAYVVLFAAGLGAVQNPPRSIETAAGPGLMLAVAGFVLGGAVLSAGSVLTKLAWLERTGIVAQAFGLAGYAFIVWQLGMAESGNRGLQLGVIVAAGLLLFLRYAQTPRAAIDPE